MSTVQVKHTYTGDFFAYINGGSLSSARVVSSFVVSQLHPASVLDVGCGAGAWCKVWADRGVANVIGTDGAYVDVEHLLIPKDRFIPHDLSKPFDLGLRFDLVTSLEVAEHIPHDSASTFVDNLAKHGDTVMFSAATPGQGGEFHVNEQPLAYWRKKFRDRGYRCFDFVRPAVAQNAAVEPWYRYNTLVYANARGVDRLPRELIATELRDGEEIPEVSPLAWRVRRMIIRNLPKAVSDRLVMVKHAWVRRRNQKTASLM